MIWSVLIGALWVLAATITAFLPMRLQMVPGIALLVAAPVLIVWLGFDFGWLVGVGLGGCSCADGAYHAKVTPERWMWTVAAHKTMTR